MMKHLPAVAFVVGAVCLVASGCHRNDTVNAEIEKWSKKGWRYDETFGHRNGGAEYLAHASSQSAGVVTAYAKEPGRDPVSKEFPQEGRYFLLVTMGGPADAYFTLIFSRQKP